MEPKKKSRYTEAQKKSIDKYRNGRAKIELNLSPEQKEQIKAAAEKQNKSMNQYIIDCIFKN